MEYVFILMLIFGGDNIRPVFIGEYSSLKSCIAAAKDSDNNYNKYIADIMLMQDV